MKLENGIDAETGEPYLRVGARFEGRIEIWTNHGDIHIRCRDGDLEVRQSVDGTVLYRAENWREILRRETNRLKERMRLRTVGRPRLAKNP